jgi:hypothetical protein
MFDFKLIAQNGGSIKLTKIIMHAFINNNGVFFIDVAKGLLTFGTNVVNVF